MKRLALIVAASLAACLFAVGCAGGAGSPDSAITVSSDAIAAVEPDTAAIAFTLNAAGDTEDAAREASDQAAQAMIGKLHEMGVQDEAIVLSKAELAQRFGEAGVTYETIGYEDYDGNWVETVEEVYYDASGDVVGYDSKARMKVSGIPADRLGAVVREAVDAGATDFGGLVYEIDAREAAYEQALAQSVEEAHAKAESLAKAGGVYVGHVVNLVENSTVPEKLSAEADASFIDPANPATFEVIPDKIPVAASVTVSYAIS